MADTNAHLRVILADLRSIAIQVQCGEFRSSGLVPKNAQGFGRFSGRWPRRAGHGVSVAMPAFSEQSKIGERG